MDSPHLAPDVEQPAEQPKSPRFLGALRSRERSGQAIVEFAFVSIAFFALVFGTIDFGRAIFMYSQLHNAVREGARYGKMNPTATNDIQSLVLSKATTLNMLPDNISVSCTGGCYPGCADVTVSAEAYFSPLTARLLGLGPEDLPIKMTSSATVTSE